MVRKIIESAAQHYRAAIAPVLTVPIGLSSLSRRKLLTGMVASSLLLSACITPKLFHDKEYDENVSAFMITEDGKKLVVLGDQYHYIFDLPDKLRPVLMSRYRKSLSSTFFGFRVDGDSVTGAYFLKLPKNASDEDRQAALADGFKEEYSGFTFGGDIAGKRYSATGFERNLPAQSFNKHYSVSIQESLSPAEIGVRVLATPITLTADGALVLGGVLLAPIFLIELKNHPLNFF
ncbi:hypothetical protein [Paraburkholderia megapolitana]|uniref:hypothetical protein n=1 Tax=Paraburkholderia megapolitana TaxID=420953 RepID=UPI0038BB7A91